MAKGVVSDIQRFSVHDGPGIRTTVFLKGCNLRCFWCHNPETRRQKPELQLFLDRCIGCDKCFEVCTRHAHVVVNGQRTFHRQLCVACGECAETCYARALVLVGRELSTEEVVEAVLMDHVFYQESGGGVTISGGEPLLQRDFTYSILELCKTEGLHTAIETSADWPWHDIAHLLPVTDLVMMDIKVADGDLHRECTGVPNDRILANAQKLSRQVEPLIIRTPVIPGVSDDEEQIAHIADFIAGFPNLLYYELLPFHRLASSKYRALGLEYRASAMKRPGRDRLARLAEVARQRGIMVKGG